MKRNKLLSILILLPCAILLSSWGWVGHQRISASIINSFTEEMAMFNDWVPFLKDHASDADNRKWSDDTEGPKHYIDIDAYPEFLENGSISTSLDSCIAKHGASFVDSQGYLPWATLNSYNDIVEAIKKREWSAAKIAAADLGHYVADGFMPLHLTLNYNGQLTNNYGIHGRYESDMVGDYQDQITYDGSPVEDIEDIPGYIFAYIYENYQWVDDVIDADNTAKAVDASYGSLYTETLWDETGDYTIELFRGASHAFANLLYNAWREAGKPGFDDPVVSVYVEPVANLSVYPNPFVEASYINLSLSKADHVSVKIIDTHSRLTDVLHTGKLNSGHHQFEWTGEGIPPGIYYVLVETDDDKLIRRIIRE